MFCETLRGRCPRAPHETDCALEVTAVMERECAGCEKVTLVLDNLNTHTKGAFFNAFAGARRSHRAG